MTSRNIQNCYLYCFAHNGDIYEKKWIWRTGRHHCCKKENTRSKSLCNLVIINVANSIENYFSPWMYTIFPCSHGIGKSQATVLVLWLIDGVNKNLYSSFISVVYTDPSYVTFSVVFSQEVMSRSHWIVFLLFRQSIHHSQRQTIRQISRGIRFHNSHNFCSHSLLHIALIVILFPVPC